MDKQLGFTLHRLLLIGFVLLTCIWVIDIVLYVCVHLKHLLIQRYIIC
jgi:hypothetical protein